MRYCVGFDVGGTTVKCGLFNTAGKLLDKWEVTSRKEEDGRFILTDIAASLRGKMEEKGIGEEELQGIGLCVPGPVEKDGFVHVCVNLGWKNRYPAREMQKLLGGRIPCKVGNDANVAALGEMWVGGGKGYSNLCMVTLGTGVGGGIILNGEIIAGAHGAAAEIGHIHVRDEETEACNCGGYGCLEQVASATGIVREAKRNLALSGEESAMRAFGEQLSAKDVCDCAKAGDRLAVKTMETALRYLGLVMAQISMTADPEVFVLGGGVSKAGEYLINVTKRYYEEYTPLLIVKAELRLAELGNDAGIYGCARLVL